MAEVTFADMQRLLEEVAGSDGFDPVPWMEKNGLTQELMTILTNSWEINYLAAREAGFNRREALHQATCEIFMFGWEAGRQFGGQR